jgi:hypothetical protein
LKVINTNIRLFPSKVKGNLVFFKKNLLLILEPREILGFLKAISTVFQLKIGRMKDVTQPMQTTTSGVRKLYSVLECFGILFANRMTPPFES